MKPPKSPAKMRRDALPLSPAELIAVRKLLSRPDLDDFLEAPAAALKLSMNKRTLLNLVQLGENGPFPGARKPFTNKVLIPMGEIQAWLDAHPAAASAES